MSGQYFARKVNRAESKEIKRFHQAAAHVQRIFRGYRTRRRVGRIWIRVKNFWSEILQDVIANKSVNPTPFEGTAMAKAMDREAAFELLNQRTRAQSIKINTDNLMNKMQLYRTSETMWSKFPCVHPGRLLASEPILFSSPKKIHLLWSDYREGDRGGHGIARQPATRAHGSLALKKHRRSASSKYKRVQSYSISKQQSQRKKETKSIDKRLPSIGKKVLHLAAKNHHTSARKGVAKQQKQRKVLHSTDQAGPRERIQISLNSPLRRDEGLELGYLKLEQTRMNKALMKRGRRHANRAEKLRKKLENLLSVTQKLASS